MPIFFSLALLIGSITACQEFRKTELGASLELAAEVGFEHAVEVITSAIGFPVDIEIDYDPSHNLYPKCKKCGLHCPEKEKVEALETSLD